MQKARVASWIAVLGLLALGLPALLLFRESARPDPIREEASQVQAPNAAPTVLPAYGYVTNIGEDTVSVIDLGSQTEVDRIPVGEGPYEIALSLDERWALVTNSYTNTVSFIDTELRQEVAQVKVGILPRGLAIGPNGRAFVANSGEATMSVIDINSRTVITKVAGFPSNVWDVTIAPNGNYAYLTNEGGSGDIYQVDASTWQVSELISGVPGCGAGLAMSPDGAFLYAADPCRKALRVVNIAARTYTVQPLTMGQGAWDVAVTSSGDLALVSNEFLAPPGLGRNSISLFGASGLTELAAVPVLSTPIGIAVLGSGKLAYVASWGADAVSVVDVETAQMIASIPVGNQPWGIALTGQQLVVIKSEWQDPIPVGWANYYEITVRNNSGRIFHQITLRDALPDAIDFIDTMNTGGAYNKAANEVTWQLGDLAPGAEQTVRIRFRSTSGMAPGSSVVNEAIASCLDGVTGYDEEQTTFSKPPIVDTATPTVTSTRAPTATPSATPSVMPTSSPTSSAAATPTRTRTSKPSATHTVATATSTASVTGTITPVETPEPGSIQVFVWLDLNGDGEVDAGEPPLPGVTVLASGPGDNVAGVTDAQGLALLADVAPGAYMVTSDEVPGLVRTTLGTVVTDVSSLTVSEVIFGFRAPPQYLPLILTTE